MSNVKNARVIKNMMDALNTLISECVQLNAFASNAYCVVLSNEQLNVESYAACFGRNTLNKFQGLKNILDEVHKQASKLIPEGTPINLESKASFWNFDKEYMNAND